MGHWRIGPYLLEEDGTLRLGGASVGLSPLQRKVMLAFVSQPGTMLTREQLAERGWGHAQVSAISIARTIHGLRRLLDAGPIGGQAIRTAYGQGYCFEAEVERLESDDHAGPDSPSVWGSPQAEQLHRRLQVQENHLEARHRIRYGDLAQLHVAEGRLRQSLALSPHHGPSLVLLAQVLLLQHRSGHGARATLAVEVDDLIARAGRLPVPPAGFHATWAGSRSLLHWQPAEVEQRFPHGLPLPHLPLEGELPWVDHLIAVGRHREAQGLLEAWLETGVARVPLHLARLSACAGDIDRCLRLLEVQINREPCLGPAQTYKAMVQAHSGLPEAAVATLRQSGRAALAPGVPDPVLAYVLAQAGRHPEARALLAEARALAVQRQPLPWALWGLVAAALADDEACGALLAEAVGRCDGLAPFIAREPFLQPFASRQPVARFLAATLAVFDSPCPPRAQGSALLRSPLSA